MYDWLIDHLDDESTPERTKALREALDRDPELAHAWARWEMLGASVREELEARLPDRSLLVLYALDRNRPELLSGEERQRLQSERSALEAALEKLPALDAVAARIEEEAAAFDRLWAEHFEETPSRPRTRSDRAPSRRGASRLLTRVLLGAAVVAFAAIALFLFERDRHLVTLDIAEGEVRQLQLPDGSRVRLVGPAALRLGDPERAGAFDRRVHLAGRAYFEVRAGEEPFRVRTDVATLTVLGTSFGVISGAEGTDVVLASGRLAVAPEAAPDHVVVLEPGERSRVAPRALASTPVPVDVVEMLAWTGLLVFEATPVKKIAATLTERYRIPVGVDPALEGERVTGTFEASQPLREILSTIASTLGAELHEPPGETRTPCRWKRIEGGVPDPYLGGVRFP